jgi:hypothetical protein
MRADDPWHHWQRGQGLMQYAAVPCLFAVTGIVALLVFSGVMVATGDLGRSVLFTLLAIPLTCVGIPGLFGGVLWLGLKINSGRYKRRKTQPKP